MKQGYEASNAQNDQIKDGLVFRDDDENNPVYNHSDHQLQGSNNLITSNMSQDLGFKKQESLTPAKPISIIHHINNEKQSQKSNTLPHTSKPPMKQQPSTNNLTPQTWQKNERITNAQRRQSEASELFQPTMNILNNYQDAQFDNSYSNSLMRIKEKQTSDKISILTSKPEFKQLAKSVMNHQKRASIRIPGECKNTQFRRQKEYHNIFNKWRDFDFITTILAMIGLSLAVANYEIEMSSQYDLLNPNLHKNAMEDPRNQKTATNMVRMIILITTLLAVTCLFMRHYYKIQWLNLYFQQDSDTHIYYQYNEVIIGSLDDSMIERKRLWNRGFITEIAILLISPIPYFDCYITIIGKGGYEVVYLLSEFLIALMWFRIYFLIRSIFNYSIYTDAYSKKLCKSYGFTAGARFTLKCQIMVNPEWTVFILFTSTIFILAYVLRIFELPYFRMQSESSGSNSMMDSYFNALWLIVITLTTVGYGDISPCTFPGRIVAMISALWGAFLISLLVVTVSSIFDLNTNQKMALRHIRLTRRAAVTISSAIKFFLAKKRYYMIKQCIDPKNVERSLFVSMLRSGSQAARLETYNELHGHHHSDLSIGDSSEGCNIHKHQLEIAERIVMIQKKNMLDMLSMFRNESGELRKLKEERNSEQFILNKLIKNEVIDMADRMEIMEEQINAQSLMIKNQNMMMIEMMKQLKQGFKIQQNSSKRGKSSYDSQDEGEDSGHNSGEDPKNRQEDNGRNYDEDDEDDPNYSHRFSQILSTRQNQHQTTSQFNNQQDSSYVEVKQSSQQYYVDSSSHTLNQQPRSTKIIKQQEVNSSISSKRIRSSNHSSQGNFMMDIQPTRQSVLNKPITFQNVDQIFENDENEEEDVNISPHVKTQKRRDESQHSAALSDIKMEGNKPFGKQRYKMDQSMDDQIEENHKLSFIVDQNLKRMKLSAVQPGHGGTLTPNRVQEDSQNSLNKMDSISKQNRRSPFYQASMKYTRRKTKGNAPEHYPISFMQSIQKQELNKMRTQGLIPSEADSELPRINQQLTTSADQIQRTASLDAGDLKKHRIGLNLSQDLRNDNQSVTDKKESPRNRVFTVSPIYEKQIQQPLLQKKE